MDKSQILTLHELQVVPSVFALQMQFPLILSHRRVLLIVPPVTQLHSAIFNRCKIILFLLRTKLY